MSKTLQEATVLYLDYLQDTGKSPRTLGTYRVDLKTLLRYLGADLPMNSITPLLLGKFLKSSLLLQKRKSGEMRSDITVNKNIRVVRQFFIWAKEQGLSETLPLPKSVPLGRSRQD